jgi:hypothetical protein
LDHQGIFRPFFSLERRVAARGHLKEQGIEGQGEIKSGYRAFILEVAASPSSADDFGLLY